MAPRLIFVRHGETEWSKSGQHTSVTDLPLTENGVKRVRATGKALVGRNRLVNPDYVEHIFVSPRSRAQQTLKLFFEDEPETLSKIPQTVTEDIREWDYGQYEGRKSADIRADRTARGIDKDGHKWNIWSDGCEDGESPEEVQKRVDELIREIRVIHKKALDEKKEHCDVMVFAHGHILRVFALRWINGDITINPALILEAGGVGVLSYEHENIEEPAIYLGGAFFVPDEDVEKNSGLIALAGGESQ
ncbi:Sedoheptulose 1,7-bisphosphatase [Yarrowia sp. C11]|nr:Sedoheptulose 1,7-bisphosphatase [Yarrowia sp. E02]KAG5369263.1 Sedoheptulose 1,7-bisphosphatase [Yarrowia sp. C11]